MDASYIHALSSRLSGETVCLFDDRDQPRVNLLLDKQLIAGNNPPPLTMATTSQYVADDKAIIAVSHPALCQLQPAVGLTRSVVSLGGLRRHDVTAKYKGGHFFPRRPPSPLTPYVRH